VGIRIYQFVDGSEVEESVERHFAGPLLVQDFARDGGVCAEGVAEGVLAAGRGVDGGDLGLEGPEGGHYVAEGVEIEAIECPPYMYVETAGVVNEDVEIGVEDVEDVADLVVQWIYISVPQDGTSEFETEVSD
jgi:hypothetical protein